MARDAAEITPKFVPLDALRPRDNSGGLGFDPYNAEWDDGGRVTGPKSYLSASGGGKGRKRSDSDDD